MQEDQGQSPSTRAVAYQVDTICDYPTYRALRQAKRSLNRFDQAFWTWRYAVLPGLLFVFMLCYGAYAGMRIEDFLSRKFISAMLPIFLGLVVFIAAADGLFELLMRWFFKRLAMANKPISISLTPESLIWSSDGIQGEISWTKIIRIVTFRDYVFFFISKMEAIGISRRAAASNDDFDNLITYAKERVNG